MKKKGTIKTFLVVAGCLSVLFFTACRHKTDQEALSRFCNNQLPQWNDNLTQVIISDIFTPAVCSRIFAYTNIAAYEALRPGYKNYQSYAGKLNGLNALP